MEETFGAEGQGAFTVQDARWLPNGEIGGIDATISHPWAMMELLECYNLVVLPVLFVCAEYR